MAAGEMTMPGLDKKPPKAPERAQTASRAGLVLERFFTRPGVDPIREVEWDLRAAVISGEDGRVVFEQRDVEVPRAWSQTATNVVVSKYFRGPLGTPAARDQRPPAYRPRGRHHRRMGRASRATSPTTPRATPSRPS